MYRSFGKRLLDVALSAALLAVFTPVIGLVALIVRLTLGAPVLFRQVRPGLQGDPFVILKFRTMLDSRDPNQVLLPDADRLPQIGRLLRALSLDELPELWNVLRGDMSLVGPRPLLMQYLTRYSPVQRRRHEVRPGITGLAQVSGRNAVTWERKFELDVQYVEKLSFALDLHIAALTVLSVLRREGITKPGHATTSEFTGTPRA